MNDIPDLSKQAQIERATSKAKRLCPETGKPRSECDCRSCIGRRSSRKGRQGQRRARTALRLNPEKFKGREGNEESWRSRVRVEVKSGAQVKPIATRYVNARAQSDAASAVGDLRPFVFAAIPDGSDELLIVARRDLPDFVQALIDEWTS